MYPVSANYLAQVRQSYGFYVYADLYYNGAKIQSNVGVVDGSITVDRTQNIRRSASVTLGDTSLWQTFVQSPLAPFGAELRVYHGMKYNDGTTEVVPLGIFNFQTISKEESFSQQNGGLPQITMNDRSAVLQRAQLLQPVDYSGWGGIAAVKALTSAVMPNVVVVASPSVTDIVLPGATTYSSDRLSAVSAICAAMGAEAYFDVLGQLQIVPVPVLTQSTPVSAASWTIDASTPAALASGASQYGVLVTAKRGTDRTAVFNAVAVYGNATGSAPQPYYIAYDIDPRSPTHWGGSFGQCTNVVTNNAVTSIAQAQVAANAALANSLGAARTLAFTIAPNAALEAGDILEAIFSDGSVELHILDSFQVPMNPANGQFTGTTRTLTYQINAGQ